MKPIAFLRSAFKRKGKKKSFKTSSSVEPLSSIPAASPRLGLTEVNPALSLGFEYPHRVLPVVDRPVKNEVENSDILSSSTCLDLQGARISPLLSRPHDSLQDASTAVLNLEGAVEPQHSLQPPLHLWPRPPSPILRSPTIVKFAPEPQTRKMYLSSLRQTPRRIGIQKKACVSSDVAEIFDERSLVFEEIDITATNSSSSSGHTTASHASADSPSTSHSILDSPTSSTMKTFVCASSLSPHHSTQMASELKSQSHGEIINSSQDTLASFPCPPPLKVKRRPQPLILLPTLTTDRLPPSPLVSSTDSTPPVTPLSTPRSPKFPNRPLHMVIPPRCSPPSTPLPTPPTSSVFLTPSDHRRLPGAGKVLRTAHSTSELSDNWFRDSYPAHNAVSSTPLANVFASDNNGLRCLNPDSKSDYSSLEAMEMPHQDPLYERSLSEIKIQWGYAL